MDFRGLLDGLLTNLDFTNAAVSRYAALDASLISRFRTGARVPSRDSEQLLKLCRGIVLYAESCGRTDDVLDYIGSACPRDSDVETQCSEVYSHLCGELVELKPRRNKPVHTQGKLARRKSFPVHGLNDKLDRLMKLFGVTNIELARAVSVDTSLISRIRAGVRLPSSDSRLIPETARFFSLRANDKQQLLMVYDTAGINPAGEVSSERLASALTEWFLGGPDPAANEIADSFITALNSSVLRRPTPMPFGNMPMPSGKRLAVETFSGVRGLKQGVLRFLAESASQPDPRTVMMYCDHGLGWLLDDENFGGTWMSMMFSAFYRGNRFKVIYDLNLSSNETFTGIERWLPLFMTGMVEPYRMGATQESCFCNLLFVCPGVSALHASFVRGGEAEAEYIYSNDPTMIRGSMAQFDRLFSLSLPLMSIHIHNSFLSCFGDILDTTLSTSALRTFSTSPKVWTLPEGDLEDAMKHAEASSKSVAGVMDYRASRVKTLQKACGANGLYEIFPLADKQELDAGNVFINLPRTLYDPIPYSADLYRRHLRSIADALRQNPGYHVTLLAEAPFEHIQVAAAAGSCVLVFKDDPPAAVFQFEHPALVCSFSAYLDSLEKYHGDLPTDRNAIIEYLENY